MNKETYYSSPHTCKENINGNCYVCGKNMLACKDCGSDYKDKEIVICAAVKTNTGKIFRGHRHGDCFSTIHENHYKAGELTEDQGFITSRNRFVSRKEGLALQLEAGIKSESPEGYVRELYSEDLY